MAELNNTALILDANLEAYYRGENVNDSTAGASHLTNVNSVAFNPAKYSNGFDFGATNTTKYLTVASDLGIAGNSDATFSFWVKCQAEIGSGTWLLLKHRSTTGADRGIGISYEYNGGTRRLAVDVSGTSYTYNITLGTTNYYHIVVTRNVAGNSSHLWVNNADVASGTVGSTTYGNNFLTLGASEVPDNYSSVFMDDVACFKDILTSDEIATLYRDAEIGGFMFFST